MMDSTYTKSHVSQRPLMLDALRETAKQLDGASIPKKQRFIASPYLIVTRSVQTFVPRSKKKRIVKKCKKKYTITWEEPDPNFYSFMHEGEEVIAAHPQTMNLLRKNTVPVSGFYELTRE